jgi:hypothetical protein
VSGKKEKKRRMSCEEFCRFLRNENACKIPSQAYSLGPQTLWKRSKSGNDMAWYLKTVWEVFKDEISTEEEEKAEKAFMNKLVGLSSKLIRLKIKNMKSPIKDKFMFQGY